VASRRPATPIIALTRDESVRRRLSVVWGIVATVVPWLAEDAAVLDRFAEPVRASGLVAPGSRVVVTAGWPFARGGASNLVHVATL
jgi:pyruvate kinase